MKQKLDVKHSDPHHDAITCPCMALVLYIFTGFCWMKTKFGCKNYSSYLHHVYWILVLCIYWSRNQLKPCPRTTLRKCHKSVSAVVDVTEI
jgi:hypothetical protein